MKVLILSTSEGTGGAAVAANRLMNALSKSGVSVKMLVRDRKSDDPRVVALNDRLAFKRFNFIRFVWERLIIFLCNHLRRTSLFQVSIANTGTDISHHPLVEEADIIHLHWVNQGFLSLLDIKRLIETGKPVVWTMHDMWPCTAICHYSYGCERFHDSCGCCPFLYSHWKFDLSYFTFQKKRFFKESKLQLVAVSSWLKEQAMYSALTKGLPVEVIPNVIDTDIFKPGDKDKAREELCLPRHKRILLMGAARINNPIKGLDYLIRALSILKAEEQGADDSLFVVLFGGIKGDDSFLKQLPVSFEAMGLLHDTTKIAKLYMAADVTVVPSLYETFGQTIIEGMACGCPAVTFNNSGQTDIIDHKKDGYLARYKDPEDLARGIRWALSHADDMSLKEACAQKVKDRYRESVVAEKYINLYQHLRKE